MNKFITSKYFVLDEGYYQFTQEQINQDIEYLNQILAERGIELKLNDEKKILGIVVCEQNKLKGEF